MNYRHELQNTGNNSCVSCLGWRWHGGIFLCLDVLVQRSVASAWREKCKQVVSGVRGDCDDVTCPFLHSGVVQVLKAGRVDTINPFCCPNIPLQSSYIWFAGWPKPDSYRGAQNRLNNSRVKLCHMLLWQVELFQLTKEEQPLLSLFHDGVNVTVPLQVLRDGGSQEPEWLHCSHSAVHDGEWGECRGVSPEVHYHLYSFERVQLQVVVTAPDSQLLNLLSVSSLVSVLDETDDCGVICKFQEFGRGVFRCAVICVESE